jgi:hypothetical protein
MVQWRGKKKDVKLHVFTDVELVNRTFPFVVGRG